jgi:hypothetical protein
MGAVQQQQLTCRLLIYDSSGMGLEDAMAVSKLCGGACSMQLVKKNGYVGYHGTGGEEVVFSMRFVHDIYTVYTVYIRIYPVYKLAIYA